MLLHFGTSTSKYNGDYKKSNLSEGVIALIISICTVGIFYIAYLILKGIYKLIVHLYKRIKYGKNYKNNRHYDK